MEFCPEIRVKLSSCLMTCDREVACDFRLDEKQLMHLLIHPTLNIHI